LNTTLARRMMEQTRVFTALQGVRGRPPCDIAALEQLLVRFSQLVAEQRWIKEIDINPLLVSHERILGLDARVVLHDPGTKESDIPKLAIRPYPTQYVGHAKMKDGTPVVIRPIRPEDEPLMVPFHESLSEQSVYLRYFHMIALGQRVTHERLVRICFGDFDREMALVAEHKGAILGVGRLSRIPGREEAEFSVLISDKYQRRGLGTELLRRLVQIGRDEKLKRISANILPENAGMQAVCKKLGFRLKPDPEEEVVRAEITL
jgi:acetyltransferase